MARPLLIQYDGALYLVTSRGNERRNIFKDDSDRTAFLDILSKVTKRYNWLCHSHCLMDNHYHAIIETLDGNLSEGMRQLNGLYVAECQVFDFSVLRHPQQSPHYAPQTKSQ